MRKRNCKLRDFPLHGAKINCARFSRKILYDENQDSSSGRHQYFVTGDNQNNVRFYEFMSEEQLLSFSSNANNTVQSEVSAVAVNWNETSIFSGSNRGIINVWDALEGKNTPICTLKGHATSVNCFGLFPEEQNLIASGSYDTQIKLWDHRQKDNFATLKGHTKQINSIDISPDGSCLLSGSEDGSTKLWDIGTQKVISTYSEHSAPVLRAIFHPEDRMFASCSSDRTAKYFSCDISKKTFEYISTTELVSMPITALDFSPDGRYLCTGGNDILKIWQMSKNGLLLESIDSAWKGVQDVLWCEKGIKGISSNAGTLSVWFCYLAEKKEQEDKKEQEKELKLPKIFKNASMRRQNSSQQQDRKIKPDNYNRDNRDNREGEENPKFAERNRDLEQVMNNVNLALGHLNNVAQIKNRQMKQKEEARKEMEKQKERQRKQQQRIKDDQRKQRIRLQKEKEREQKQAKQRERRQRIQKQKQQEQRKRQQRLEEMERERAQRQRLLQQQIHETFENNNNLNFEMTIQNDPLQNSSVMNISAFMGNGAQKEKLMQIQKIGEFMKESGKFQSVYKIRSSAVKPIIHYWKQGKIDSALYTLSLADVAVAYDCISAIIHNSTFKMAITPDVACAFIKKLSEIMNNKHLSYVKNSMTFLNQIVLMFKDELIKVKMFNPMTRVDLSREERLAKYDRLTQQFLNLFKQDRLKKYALQTRSTDNEELFRIAAELYKNLEEVLRKIMPRKEPEAA